VGESVFLFFDCVVVVAASLDGAWVGSLSSFARVKAFEDFGDGVGEGLVTMVRGKSPPGWLPGGG
jgi:hypothetical protein